MMRSVLSMTVALAAVVAVSGGKSLLAENTCPTKRAANCCLEEADLRLTDVSSRSNMERSGWSFNTNNDKRVEYKDSCGVHDTWYGYKYPGDGSVTATFTGSGTATLDYGNCHTVGCVIVYLNGEIQDITYKNTPSKEITFDFSPNDVLLLSETEGETIIKLNSLKITCKACTVNGLPGDGTERGTCAVDNRCFPDGDCKADCRVREFSKAGTEQGDCDEGLFCTSEGICSTCSVNGLPGDGTKRGSCDELLRCFADGNCKTGCLVSGLPGDSTQRGDCDEELLCTGEGICVLDPCLVTHCYNGGTCSLNEDNEAQCDCKPEWTGPQCNIRCKTSRNASPNPNQECVFPFKWQNIEYTKCTTVGNNDVFWCGTKYEFTESDGWGACDETCFEKEASTLPLAISDFTGHCTTAVEGEIIVQRGGAIVSNEIFHRPITVEAEMKTDGATECIAMTLFAADNDKNADISLEIGGWGTEWRFFPDDNSGEMGSVENWRKVKLDLDETDNVNYYVDDALKYSTTSEKSNGTLRFIAGCQSMKIRHIKIGHSVHEKMPVGTLCNETKTEITSESECKEAGELLGLQWGHSWNGPNDFPACLYAEDDRNRVYFNLSPNPSRTDVNQGYSAICRKDRGYYQAYGSLCNNEPTCFCKESVCLTGGDFNSGNVFIEGKPVCDDDWDITDAHVLCRTIGFLGATEATSGSRFGSVPDVFAMDDVACQGTESHIMECQHTTTDNCSASEGAGVVCYE